MKFSKRENILIKYDIPQNIDVSCTNIQTFEPFMYIAIPQEDTLL
jgi:hypothetical protein